LLVSWGGFTKTARHEARRLFLEMGLWNSEAVIDELQEVYSRLPAKVQAEISQISRLAAAKIAPAADAITGNH
jgi:predicted Mrr-cat superfamily restriction endonuclease